MQAAVQQEVTKEAVHNFLQGSNEQKYIIKIESNYSDPFVYVIYYDDNFNKRVRKEKFYPFVWCKQSTARQFFNGNRRRLTDEMSRCCIACKGLRIHNTDGSVHERMENGFRVLFYATRPMSFGDFQKFFEEAGKPIYQRSANGEEIKDTDKEYICASPTEQFMIATGKRLFKGFEDYDNLTRLCFDLETEGLDPTKHKISQIGVRTNKGFEKIISIDGEGAEKEANELKALKEFFTIIRTLNPDVVTGHNSENFDWNFIESRLKEHGTTMKKFTEEQFFGRGVYKSNKERVLKLGGEIEYYRPTSMWGYNITDSLFAVRRAQAIDSNMKKATLKYVTVYSNLQKENRVYVPGNLINTIWSDMEKHYALCEKNGDWFNVDERTFTKTFTTEDGKDETLYTATENGLHNNKDNTDYEFVTGRYIVQRYLLDDLYETDKIEARYNQSNFLVGKMLPVSYEKMCTMGTATVWKLLLLAWSYENDLAIPDLIPTKPFTGGLSRLLRVGYVDRIVKLDFNSLYPSIILTFNIKTPVDVMGAMNALLEYILSQREYYKGLKGKFGKEAKALKKQIKANPNAEDITELKERLHIAEREESRNDKMQLPLKILGNGFFGSYGSGNIFPHSDLMCAEEVTCTGRQMLRLMISHFTGIGYKPIVGDSFTGDTPLFIKYDETNDIDIVPIEKLINVKSIAIDALGREYDTSKKSFKVLCRSGWMESSYIYRHKCDKEMYRVTDGKSSVDVTQDHSLFNEKQHKIKPSEIDENTRLEYYQGGLFNEHYADFSIVDRTIKGLQDGTIEALPIELLNATNEIKREFVNRCHLQCCDDNTFNKTVRAGLLYIYKSIQKNATR